MPELISHTTRDKREGEIEGKTYYYVSEEKFNSLNLIEEVEFNGNKYGLSKKEVHSKLEENDEVIVIVDIEGYYQILNLFDEYLTIMVYIDATPFECFNRMRKERGLKSAVKRSFYDIKEGVFKNYLFSDITIRNKDLDKAKEEIRKLVGK